ncbi:MAG: triose-phosphate isomerase [bacterium]|nr:triose-phosphate isomerase [bacterium]
MHNGKHYLFANWKMYLDYDESNILANAIVVDNKKISQSVKMVIFPSALSLYNVSGPLKDVGIAVGAQNTYWVDKGGYTGEVSALMYKDAGCEYALVGHSERRHVFHETNHDVREKLDAILGAGMTPVVCVGETVEERKNNQTEEVVEIQLRAAFDKIEWPEGRDLIVAYEPVWAIGTGDNCDPIEAEELHKKISGMVSVLVPGVKPIILYGGSVRPNNVSEYLKFDHINGVLVGSASAKLDSWLEIVQNSGV